MDKKKRVLMVKNKIVSEGAIYHITQRAPGREKLFVEEHDYLKFLSLLKEITKQYSLSIFAFSLLPNHIHVLLRVNNRDLASPMKALFQRYAIYFNNKYERKGHVFCGRYRAALCNDERYLLTISAYIHLNAYRAGLSSTPFGYRWHSLDVYIKKFKDKSFIDTTFILNILSQDTEEARGSYKILMEEASKIKDIKSKDYLLELKGLRKFYRQFMRVVAGRGKMLNCKFVKKFLDIKKIQEIIDKNKRRKSLESKEAKRYVIEQLLSRGFKIEEIADHLRLHRSTVYRILNTSYLKH